MVMALIGISGNAHGAPPPNRPTITSLPPLERQSKPSCAVCALPTRSMTARTGPLRGLALARIDIDDDGALATHRLEQRQRHQPKTARAEDHDRLVEIGF